MLTRERIAAIIENNEWTSLVGEVEADFLECKDRLYDLDRETQRLELAKDAASFANAEGGTILIGIRTETSPSHFSDEIRDLRPFEQSLFDRNRYRNVIQDWVHPKIEGLHVEWKAQEHESSRGFGVISIPNQPDGLRPFLMAKTILESGVRRDILIGYAQRKRDASEPANVVQIHQWLRDGLQYQRVVESRLTDIQASIARLTDLGPGRKPGIDETVLRGRLEEAASLALSDDSIFLIVAANPSPVTTIGNFFDRDRCPIPNLLEHPPIVPGRSSGFNLNTDDRAVQLRSECWRVGSGDTVVTCYRDGMLILFIRGDRLTWSMRQPGHINPKALVEPIYLFCVLYSHIVRSFQEQPVTGEYRIRLGNLRIRDRPPAVLIAGELSDLSFAALRGLVREARSDAAELARESSASDPSLIAFQLLAEIFIWFGLEPQHVPYCEDVGGRRIVSETRLARHEP